MAAFPLLDAPLVLGGVTLRNRVVLLAHVTGYSSGGRPTPRLADYYVERARGGVGLVVTESQHVHPTGASAQTVDAFDPAAMAAWQSTLDGCHGAGAAVFAQLTHHGPEAQSAVTGSALWGASAVPNPVVGEVPHAMSVGQIDDVIAGFAAAAANAVAVGFDGVELKVGHDGLLRHFLSPATNHRQDGYGGDEAARLRLVLEVIDAVRGAIGVDRPLGVRLCLDECVPGGYGLAEACRFAVAFAERGIDYLSADRGTWVSIEAQIPPMTSPPGAAVPDAAAVRAASGLPVVAFGRIHTPAQGEAILAGGHADLVGLARPLLCDPQWVAKAVSGRPDTIRPCVACNQTCTGNLARGLAIGCVHHPGAGREAELRLTSAAQARRVVVVGGGPAGLKAAETAALRGHDVVLLEAGPTLGGQVRVAAQAPHRATWGGIAVHLAEQLGEVGVEVHLSHRATAETVLAFSPDVVVVATGSVPLPPPFPVDSSLRVFDHAVVLGPGPPRGLDVVVVDLGRRYEGPAVAEALAVGGNRVRVVTPGAVGPELDPSTAAALFHRLAEASVTLIPQHVVLGAGPEGVDVLGVFSGQVERLGPAEAVVVTGHKRADDALATALMASGMEVHVAGDAVAPRDVGAATLEGMRAGLAV